MNKKISLVFDPRVESRRATNVSMRMRALPVLRICFFFYFLTGFDSFVAVKLV